MHSLKTILLLGKISLLILFISACSQFNSNLASKSIGDAEEQLKYALEIIEPLRGDKNDFISPSSVNEDQSIKMVASSHWTSGFFAGELWIMYDLTQDPFWRVKAHVFTEALDKEKNNVASQNIGLKMFCSYGLGYKLTHKNQLYKQTLIQAANSLISTYNHKFGCIKSTDAQYKRWQFPVTIDKLLDLELLFFVSNLTNDTIYSSIAKEHALTTIRNHFTDDYGAYSILDYSIKEGKVFCAKFKDDSILLRNEAIALLGYSICYENTKNDVFLKQAENIATYVMNKSKDDSSTIPTIASSNNKSKDVISAAIIATALYKLSFYSKSKHQYINQADLIMSSLSDREYKSPIGENQGFLITQPSGYENSGIDAPLVYSDFYYLKALKMKMKIENIKYQ